MADTHVEYKRVNLVTKHATVRLLRSNGASFAQSFKYKYSFPLRYRRLKLTQNRSVTSERKFEARAESKNGAEILGKLTCAARRAMVP